MASFDKCFFTVSPVFSRGHIFRQCSQFHSLRYSNIMLLSYSPVCYSSLSLLNISSCPSLYLPLRNYFLYRIFRFCSPFTLMIKYIWLWSLHPSGSHILTLSINSFCELNTIYNTFSPLVGSNTCWVRKLSCTQFKNVWSSLPVLCRYFHCIRPWLKRPIIIQSRLLMIARFILPLTRMGTWWLFQSPWVVGRKMQ